MPGLRERPMAAFGVYYMTCFCDMTENETVRKKSGEEIICKL
jgi:hypothetical protein